MKSGKQRLRHRGKQRRRKGDPARDHFPVAHELSERPAEAQVQSRNIEHLTALQQARARQEEAARERENAPWWLHELGSSIWTGLRRGLNNIDIQQADAAQKSLDAMEATEGKARELRQQGTPDLLGQNIGADPFELTSAAGTWNPDELYRKKHTALERARDRNLAEYEEDLPALVPTRAAQTQREMEAYYGKKGAAESLAYIITHPRMATNMAAESLGQFAPTLLATGVATAASGPLAGAAVIGAGSAQMEHGSTLAERIDASAAQEHKSRASVLADQQLMNDIRREARTRAAVIGTTEALTFGLTGPAFHAVRARVPGWKGTLAAWGAGTGVQASGGAAGEAGAQLATHGEITSWPAVVAEFALEVLQGAPEIAFHAQTGTRLLRQEHAQDMANLRELGENVRESKTRQRAPEAFRDAVRDMAETGNMRDAYIDGDVLHQSDLAEQLANALPEQAQDIQEAVDHGGAVQISPADLITRILPNEELTAALEPHLRFDADGVSTDELNGTVQADLEADIARGVAEAAAKDVRQQEMDAIRDDFAAQLDSIGRFTPAVNKIYGTLVASFYDTTAQKLGISAQELMAQRPLNIVGEAIADGLNQPVTQGFQWEYGQRRGLFGLADIPLTELDGHELGQDERAIRANLNEQLKAYADGGLMNRDTGWELRISSEDRKKLAKWYGANLPSLQAQAALEELVENAVLAESHPDSRHENSDVIGIHRFYAPVAIDGKLYRAKLTVRDYQSKSTGNRTRLRRLEAIETEDAPMGTLPMPEANLQTTAQPTSGRLSLSVRALLNDAKRDDGSAWDFSDNLLHQDPAPGGDFSAQTTEQQRQLEETARQHGGEEAYAAAKEAGETELNYQQWVQVRTPAFKAWFGDWQDAYGEHSVVVNPRTGEPLVVYHATRGERFEVFDRAKLGDNTYANASDLSYALTAGLGHWFNTQDLSKTSTYAGGRSEAVFLDIREPLQTHSLEELAERLAGYEVLDEETGEAKTIDEMTPEEVRDLGEEAFADLTNEDYDGVVLRDEEFGGQSFAAFHPNQIKSATGNNGAFDANHDSIFQQNKGTPRGAFDPTTNTIALLEKADLSTFIHELGHFFFESNINIANSLRARDNAAGGGTLTDAEKQLLKDVDALLAQANLDLDTWNIMTLEQRRGHHEHVARQFEAYLMEGKAPVPELQGLFARARAWLFQLYKKLTTLNVQLTDDVRQVFDRMIAGEAAINQARQMRLGVEMLLDADLAGMTADEFKQFQQQFQDATNLALDEMQLRQLADAKAIARLKHKALQNKNKEAQAARGLMEMDARRIIYSQPVYRAWQLLTAKMTPDTTIASRKRAWTDSVEPAHDDLFTAIAKLGGINRQQIESTWGFDPADKIRPVKPGFFVLRKTGGESIDGMKRLLEQYGYLSDQDTLNDFYDLFMEQHRGNSQYSNRHIPDTSSGKAGEGANLQNLPAFRLDYRSLEDMGYSEDQINSLGKKVQKSGGIHPDLLAELILDEQGNAVYGSGDELVLDLMTVPDPKTAVRDLADRMMQQQYSELATPQAIAEAADLAIHNDLTLRLLATEYNALAKASGKPALVSRVARQLARDVIGRTRIRDLNPTKYTRMEAKAAKRAFTAAKNGDIALAAAEKRSQLLQAAHAREALEAKAEIKKMINYLRRADNLNPKSIDPGYREQIEALLDGYSLRQRSNKALDRRQSLADWVQDQRNQGFEPDVPEQLLDDLNRKPWQELTVDELRGLADTVKQIEHIGKTKQELLTARKNKNAKKRIANMAQAVEDNAPWADRDNRTPVSATGRARVWAKGFAADHRRVAMLTQQMDGNTDGGIITDTLICPANVAGDTESAMTAHAIDYFRQHVVPAYNRKSAQRRAYPLGGKNVSLSDREIFTMLLNWGNEGNRLRLLDGEGWTVAEVEALFAARLTADDARAVQKAWDYYADHTKDKIAAIARRVDGIEPQWVEALAFTFTDASGESVDLQGGYYPIMKDPMRSPTVQAQQEMDMRNGNTGRAAVRDGFTKNRAKRVYGQPLRYDLAGIYQGLGDVIHYIAWREWAVDANRLLGDNEFTRAVMRKYGAEALKQLRSWRDDIISNGNREREGGIQVLSTLRQNIALANLGFSSTTAVAQALGLFQSMVRVGHSNILWGTLRYLASPLELTRTARAASTLLQNRGRTQFRELNELRNMVGERSKIRSAASKWGFWLLLKVQGAVDIITWHAQYEKSILNGATDEDAVAQADQAVLDSQGSGMLKDLSAAERGGELKKLLTIHYNYMNTVYNLQYNSLTARNNSVAKKIADVLTLSVVMVIADHALRSLLTPGDDDKWDEDQWYKTIGRDVLAFQFGQFVGLRELTGIINGYGYSGPTGTSPFANMAKLAQQAGQGEADDAFFRALVQAGGSLTGLPSAQINRTMKGARALADDDTDNPLALAFGYQQ